MASVSRDVRGCLRKRVSVNVGWCGVLWLLSFLCVWYVLVMFHAHILRSYIRAYTYLVRCVFVLRYGLAGVVWYPDAGEALLVCSCGMWGLGVNDRLE